MASNDVGSGWMPNRMCKFGASVSRHCRWIRVSTWRASWEKVFERFYWLVLLEGVKNCSLCIADEECANVSWMNGQRDYGNTSCSWVQFRSKTW